MAFESLVALEIKNEELYNKYREGIKPIAKKFEGSISYDFRVSEVLNSPNEKKVNRVFAISFPNQNKMEEFFSNEEYLKVKEEYFIKSVGDMQILASYEK